VGDRRGDPWDGRPDGRPGSHTIDEDQSLWVRRRSKPPETPGARQVGKPAFPLCDLR